MKHILAFVAMLTLALAPAAAQVNDTVDVLDYDITLDMSSGIPYSGTAVITARLLQPCSTIGLELIGPVDSLMVNGNGIYPHNLNFVPTAGIAVGQEFTITVLYRLSGYVETSGWGGLHVENNMTYNLGVGFGTNPHSVGRTVFPCRDNFGDKATYTLRLTTRAGWSAECSGVLQSRTTDADGHEHSVWRIDHPVSTYLVGISQAPFHRIERTVAGYPLTIGYTTQDSATVSSCFELLDAVVPKYEQCFGPYRWHRIGYIPTSRGSMEHVNNIALAYQAMDGISAMGQSTIAHELGHAWFGNLVTCATEGDMWINEGGASFCSEVAREATHGRASSDKFYQQNLETVIRTAHLTEGYIPLSNMPHSITYGTTTYDKGGLVWHSLRGYVGEDNFYAAMRKLFSRCAFGNLSAEQLRDSLSLYTGMDLTGFFDFHVFGGGYVDYHVGVAVNAAAGNQKVVDVRLRQQGIGTDAIARQSRVPLTFVGSYGEQHKEWFTFSSADTTFEAHSLPFRPIYCLIDADCAISDAATVDSLAVSGTVTRVSEVCYMRIRAEEAESDALYHVEHHWGHPFDLDTLAGVVRSAGRYWRVGSIHYLNAGVQGRFLYVRTGNNNSTYPNLDLGFYSNTASLDSMAVLWRLDEQSPWLVVSCRHTMDRNEGYFVVDNLRPGEYALACIDTALLGITSAVPQTFALFPNPVRRGEQITIDVPGSEPYNVEIYDESGRRQWHRNGCRGGSKIAPRLKSGTYLVVIKNNYVSLQSKLIVL